MNKFITPVSAITLMLGAALTGCSECHESFAEFHNIEPRGWAYGDSISFIPIALDSTTVNRQLKVAIRHSNDFLYRSLWLEVSYPDITGRQHSDTVKLDLADSYGRWLGKGLGPSFQIEGTASHSVAIADSSVVNVRHIMRLDTLRGIEQVGITLTPVK